MGKKVNELILLELITKFNSALMLPIAQAGMRAFLYREAGYEIKAEPKKQMSQLDILQANLDILKEHEQRLAKVEHRFKDLDHHAVKFHALPPTTEGSAPVKSDRAKLNELVRLYCLSHAMSYRDVWNKLYSELKYRCHIDVKIRAKNKGCSPLDIAEETGFILQLCAIAEELLRPRQ